MFVVRGAVVHDEADQSGLFLCVVTPAPADPDVGVLGEEVFLFCLFHHLLLQGIRPVCGHVLLGETSAQCTSTLRCPGPSRSLGLGI